MKPPKPRITKPRLVWRWKGGGWIPRHRITWMDSGKQRGREVTLDWKGDPKELDRLYWLAQAGQHEAQKQPSRYTWRECIVAWRSDRTVQDSLKASTRASYRRPMDALLTKNGDKDMRKTTRTGIKAALAGLADTPRKASRYAQTISLLWNYAARELDWPLGPNPAAGLGAHKAAKPFEPWPAWMLKALDDAPENVRIAAMLIRYTGQRPSAAIAMRRDQIEGDWMQVRDEKGGQELDVFCPEALRMFVDSLPIRGAHLIAKTLREPVGYDGVEKAFRRWRDSLGDRAKPYSLHGLRKLAIIELAEAGASDAEIQAVTGQSAPIVAYYRSKASRRRLSKAAQERRSGNDDDRF